MCLSIYPLCKKWKWIKMKKWGLIQGFRLSWRNFASKAKNKQTLYCRLLAGKKKQFLRFSCPLLDLQIPGLRPKYKSPIFFKWIKIPLNSKAFFPSFIKIGVPVDIWTFKVKNRNTRTRCEICSKLTIKTTEWRY